MLSLELVADDAKAFDAQPPSCGGLGAGSTSGGLVKALGDEQVSVENRRRVLARWMQALP